MGCIHTRNSNKSTIIICVMELKYYIYQSVIWHVGGLERPVICGIRGLEAIRHLRRWMVRGDPSFAVIEVERDRPNQRINNSRHISIYSP